MRRVLIALEFDALTHLQYCVELVFRSVVHYVGYSADQSYFHSVSKSGDMTGGGESISAVLSRSRNDMDLRIGLGLWNPVGDFSCYLAAYSLHQLEMRDA